MQRKILFAGLTAAVMLTAVGSAQAQSLAVENIQVRLPGGELLTFHDRDDWHRDPRVAMYKNYYYEPRDRTYVVYRRGYPKPWGYRHHWRDRDDHGYDRGDRHEHGRR